MPRRGPLLQPMSGSVISVALCLRLPSLPRWRAAGWQQAASRNSQSNQLSLSGQEEQVGGTEEVWEEGRDALWRGGVCGGGVPHPSTYQL